MQRLCAAIIVLGLGGLSQAWGQAYGPTPTGTTYGRFGPRTLGVPLTPLPRTTFATEPRQRLGANMGIGQGGPVNVLANQETMRWIPQVPTDRSAPAFQEAQSQATQYVRSGVRSSIPDVLQTVSPEVAEPMPADGAGPPDSDAEAPATQPMRSDTQTQPIRSPGAAASAADGGARAAVPMRADWPVLSADFADATARRIADGLRRAMGDSADNVRVGMAGETAVLRGRVRNAHDRLLAEEMARLEPGVWDVRNELTVAAPAAPRGTPGPRR